MRWDVFAFPSRGSWRRGTKQLQQRHVRRDGVDEHGQGRGDERTGTCGEETRTRRAKGSRDASRCRTGRLRHRCVSDVERRANRRAVASHEPRGVRRSNAWKEERCEADGAGRKENERLTIRDRRESCCVPSGGGGCVTAVHYTGKLDDGSVFDTSREREPLEFVVGGGKVIAGFDDAVLGLQAGESRMLQVGPEKAYGSPRTDLVADVPKESAPDGLEVGNVVQLSNGMTARITSITDDAITIDANHPLAGMALTFEVELLDLVPASSLGLATFGGGCFWGLELAYQRLPGVLSTSVGYANGTKEDPTYQEVCSGETGHAEAVQVTYNPKAVGYEQLLKLFWDRIDPTTLNRQGNDVGTQYRTGIYVHTPEQREIALRSLKEEQAKHDNPIVTEVEDLSVYYPAEDYHQQYLQKGGQSAEKECSDPIRCYG